MFGKLATLLVWVSIAAAPSRAAVFVCQPDVDTSAQSRERRFTDEFWKESLAYLKAYLQALETPTGECRTSAEAMVETDDIDAHRPRTRCILQASDMAANARHGRPVLAEPNKARACFDAQKNYQGLKLYSPSKAVRDLTQTSKWINRPLLSDYYQPWGGKIGAAGLELSSAFLAITSHGASKTHWASGVMCPTALRIQAWSRIARDLDRARIASLTQTITLEDVIAAASKILSGDTRGRTVVEI